MNTYKSENDSKNNDKLWMEIQSMSQYKLKSKKLNYYGVWMCDKCIKIDLVNYVFLQIWFYLILNVQK